MQSQARPARDKEMSLLSGHHRIMEAAEAALVMMVLEEGGSFWASYRNCQLSGECVELAMI